MLENGIFERISGPLSKLVESRLDFVRRKLDLLIGAWPPGGSNRTSAEALYWQAQTKMRSGDLAAALALLSRSMSLAPKFEDAAEGYGEALDRLGKVAEAAAMYEESRQIGRAHV